MAIIQLPIQSKIILIGDNCVDVYDYGTVDRISPEAPVPVFKLQRKDYRPGMAANVQANLENLGCVVESHLSESSIKTRLIDIRSGQQIVRIDVDEESNPINLSNVDFKHAKAVVISDYNKGFVTYETIEEIIRKFRGPIFIDTKKTDLKRFNGCIVKINESEFKVAQTLNDNLIVTLGEDGAMWKQNDNESYFESHHVEVADVCGAGDTFLAALTFKFLETNDMPTAINFAIKASSITIQHRGVYAPTLEEIKCLD